ncbi:MAG TPA: fused MFS/spermidine synthase [Vicinamibacteria bacterium]|nr:fused MFS/spermidine synthase [Vicinamibacteria bacterium]
MSGPQPQKVRVRRTPAGLELRVDGTLASVSRPGRALTGVVWWALAAPVLLLPPARRQVLLLGLAAGSVARALRRLDPDARLVGVERDREVLRVARDEFDLDALRVEVAVEDALVWLRRERRRFDLVVEDLFLGPARSVHKPEWLAGEGYRLIRRRLREGGLLVSNTIHEMPQIVRAAAPVGRVLSLDVRGYHNRIVVAGRRLPSAREVRRRLAACSEPALASALRRLSIRRRHPRRPAAMESDVSSPAEVP